MLFLAQKTKIAVVFFFFFFLGDGGYKFHDIGEDEDEEFCISCKISGLKGIHESSVL